MTDLPPDIAKMVERVTKQLIDGGHPVEAGWNLFRTHAVSAKASPIQLDEMRLAFFAGAQHLYGSIMTVLDPGDEVTDADLRRMELIHNELETFADALKVRIGPARAKT